MKCKNVLFAITVLTFLGVGIQGRPQALDEAVVVGKFHFVRSNTIRMSK